MVETVKDWKTIEAYAGFKQGFYQIIENQKSNRNPSKRRQIRIQKEFNNPKDPLINRIIKFCKSKSYVKLANNVEADHSSNKLS